MLKPFKIMYALFLIVFGTFLEFTALILMKEV